MTQSDRDDLIFYGLQFASVTLLCVGIALLPWALVTILEAV